VSARAGVLLRRSLDQGSPTARFDARALQQELKELQQSLAPGRMITAVKRRGSKLEVSVLAASTPRATGVQPSKVSAGGASVTAWRPDSW